MYSAQLWKSLSAIGVLISSAFIWLTCPDNRKGQYSLAASHKHACSYVM
jgi:hypothetical protein